jgi:hypothetical protein
MEKKRVVFRNRVDGEIDYNDGESARVQTIGVEKIERDFLLKTIRIRREDTNDTPEEFQRRFPVGTRVNIHTTTEITAHSSADMAKHMPIRPVRTKYTPTRSFRDIEDVRLEFNCRYPEANDPPQTEHPMTAVGIVLISAIILGTTEISELVTFTGYSENFISAIAFNMTHNKLWVDGAYDESQFSTWLSPDRTSDDVKFWDHIEIACGNMWRLGVEKVSFDAYKIYRAEQETSEVASKLADQGEWDSKFDV